MLCTDSFMWCITLYTILPNAQRNILNAEILTVRNLCTQCYTFEPLLFLQNAILSNGSLPQPTLR